MKIKINDSIEIETSYSLKEIAERIMNNTLDLNEKDNLINWRNVWSVVKLK